MKKIFIAMMMVLLAVGLIVSCDSNVENNDGVVVTLMAFKSGSDYYYTLYENTTATSLTSIVFKNADGKSLGELVDSGKYFVGITTFTNYVSPIISSNKEVEYFKNLTSPTKITTKTSFSESTTVYVGFGG